MRAWECKRASRMLPTPPPHRLAAIDECFILTKMEAARGAACNLKVPV